MTTTQSRRPQFNAAFADLLRAFNAHEDNRRAGAGVPALSRSSHELFKARMAMHHVTR